MTRTCNRCAVERPVDEFARDARTATGRRGVCKPCDRAAQTERRHKSTAAEPRGLVLAPKFPDPPAAPVPPAPDHGPCRVEIEKSIRALDPPSTDADALAVYSLRELANLHDLYRLSSDRVNDLTKLEAAMVRWLRELKATRASATPAAEARPTRTKTAAGY